MVPLDHIRIRGRRLNKRTRTRTPFSTMVRTPTHRDTAIPRLVLVHNPALLLSWKLAIGRLTPLHGAVVPRASSGLLVRDHVVCGAPIRSRAALSVVGNLVIGVVWIRVLQDHVPGVKEAGKKAETAQGEVDEGVGATKAFLDPYSDRGEEHAQEHQKAVGTTHSEQDMDMLQTGCGSGGVGSGGSCAVGGG